MQSAMLIFGFDGFVTSAGDASCAVAFLVFLTRAARTWVVPSHFLGATHNLLHSLLGGAAATGHAGLFEFATLLPLESLFEVID
jgi:hypothetical protein